VTGSGKTEVYIRAVLHCLQLQRTALILVPEITLAQQMVQMLSSRLPGVAMLHSGMSAGERYQEWSRIRSGEASVVMGARSAVFAPLADLGLIILDEEQEDSYKNEEYPRYHAREVAQERARRDGGVFLLGSATPRVETLAEVLAGETHMLTLKNKVAAVPRLHIQLEDSRQLYKQSLGALLTQEIAASLSRREQVVLFVNRRGHSPRTVCRRCGSRQLCPHCAVALVYHADQGKHICHYCNYALEVIDRCGTCGSDQLAVAGAGTQRVEEEVRKLFPAARTERLDLDTRRKKGYSKSVIQRMQQKEIDILIGTQMVAKGLHFPEVSLVGVIDADALLALPDYRAEERAFQLLLQAAGRSGRGDAAGRVVIQTYQPENPLMRLLLQQDYLQFALQEIDKRKTLGYPPFEHICRVVLYGKNEALVKAKITALGRVFAELLDAQEHAFAVLGPAPCPLSKIKDRYRYQLMIKSPYRAFLVSVVKRLKLRAEPQVQAEIDFDPVNTM
jgi:primosomal protein N' (replication factor Y)